MGSGRKYAAPSMKRRREEVALPSGCAGDFWEVEEGGVKVLAPSTAQRLEGLCGMVLGSGAGRRIRGATL